MNSKIKTKQYHKKIKPTKNNAIIRFFQVLKDQHQQFFIFQDTTLNCSIWSINQASIKNLCEIQLQQPLTCSQYMSKQNLSNKINFLFATQNGNIYVCEYQHNNSICALKIVFKDKIFQHKIMSLGQLNDSWLVIDRQNNWNCFQYLDNTNKIIIKQENIKNAPKPLFIQKQKLMGESSNEYYLMISQNAMVPHLVKSSQIKEILTKTNNNIIESIQKQYQNTIDANLNLRSISCFSISMNCNKKIVVIGLNNGRIIVFNVEDANKQLECSIPHWYQNCLIPILNIELDSQIFSVASYRQYFAISTQSKVYFLDISERKKAFESLKQKQSLQINKIMWTNNQKIIMVGLQNSPKAYIFEKHLPIKALKNEFQ